MRTPIRGIFIPILILVQLACNGGATPTRVPKIDPPTPTPTDPPSPVTHPPSPTTGTIRGRVEYSPTFSSPLEPLADTIVEIAGWEDTFFTTTNAQGEYRLTDVPPGLHMLIPQASQGWASYQSVNVVAGGEAVADFTVLTAYPVVFAVTLQATVRVDSLPVSGARLWVTGTSDVYESDDDGHVSFVYSSPNGSPVIVVYQDRWDILQVPFDGQPWTIDLSHVGDPPSLPDDMTVVVDRGPIVLELLLPTPFELVILPGLRQTQEDCISFEGLQAELAKVDGRVKIAVGDILLLDFGSDLGEAEQALKILRQYGFNQQCFVGRPDPSMQYYLIDGKAPSGPLAGEDCLGFDPKAIQVGQVNGRWKITDATQILMDFAAEEAEARNAYKIIRKYAFDNLCFVGRPDPSLVYFRD